MQNYTSISDIPSDRANRRARFPQMVASATTLPFFQSLRAYAENEWRGQPGELLKAEKLIRSREGWVVIETATC